MDALTNPWAARFEPLFDPNVLKQRAVVTVPALSDLATIPEALASKQLEVALDTIFHPTTQCVAILRKLIGIAHAHCTVTYPDAKTFLGGVYANEPPLPGFVMPICLTGLSGVGKTCLIKAFKRVLLPDEDIVIDSDHSAFPLNGAWSITVQARSTPKDILKCLVGADGSPSDLIKECRKLGFRDGVPIVLADEFQFATGSNSANTRVTQMLLSLGYIGIPFLFAANYSLLHRLLKRPEEEQQRLLSNPIVLNPDSWNSQDWVDTLRAQQAVAPDYLKYDPGTDARDFHAYSAGRKRAMAKLLVLAFKREYAKGGIVDRRSVRLAYESSEYALYKKQAEILATQAIQNRPQKSGKDLWCPIPAESTMAIEFLESRINMRQESVAEAELAAALTKSERQQVAQIKNDGTSKTGRAGKVVSIRTKSAPTAEELKRNASWFLDQI